MPTLNLQKKTKKETNQRNENTASREIRRKAYNNTEWRKLRDTYIKEHPLCEDCLNEGKVVPAEDVHHIRSPFQNGECNKALLLDYNNLMALCKQCHNKRHNPNQAPKIQDVLRQLADLLDENKTDEELEDEEGDQ